MQGYYRFPTIYKNKIVFGHYPIISNGAYNNHMKPLHKLLYPIFKKHNVRAYVSGHDHNIQYMKKEDNGYNFDNVSFNFDKPIAIS